MPKAAWSILLFPAVLLVTLITGCGSESDSPDAKKARQERAAAIAQDDAKDNAEAKSKRGKKQANVKSIKGRLGGAGAD